jgi:hypothetical protein
MNLIKERRPKMSLINNKEEKNIYQYDHYIAIDWSQLNVAIARMKKNSTAPQVKEKGSDIREVKRYFPGIKWREILTIEETTSTHWLAVELYEKEKEEYHKYFNKIKSQNKLIRNLETIHGVGTIFAVKIYSVIIDARRFANKYQYWSYCGLVLNEKESGGRSYGKRRPRYSRQLKGIYNGAALAAIGGNNDIAEYYNHLLGKGLSERQARVSIARYIAKVSYGMLKNGGKYIPYKWRKTKGKEEDNK